ncbi:dipeptidase [Paracoccus aminophilus]|uniref:Membrane dipeptidase n=1 Tax=Paracoccus aminophilus JCM 7686 TaxID=1367847 RepID=S5Z1F9_PARAH|nr:dipeptidase [Paracoccus aminophilus]AGT11276.1 membrane dipeptidase [Paracoccus aminophilus JCM 7686]
MSDLQVDAVFDGHNDALLRIWHAGGPDAIRRFIEGDEIGHIDLPRARQGKLAGGLCAIYVPSERVLDSEGNWPTPSRQEALEITTAMAGILTRIERQSEGGLTICRKAADIRRAMAAGSFASVFHIEGVEAIGADLDLLYLLHAAGLRSLGPVWSRPNLFAFGVPFRFPSTPEIGPGLSAQGKALIRACNELKIMVDLSHMNDAGFWDIAKISDAPLVASHSNVHAICPHSRNVTDRQLDAIKDTGGLVGINFGVAFLNPTGERDTALPLEVMLRHIDYIVDRIGIDHVALGSDFDGTTIPAALRDASDLPKLVDVFKRGGYDGDDLAKITHGNWLRVLERTWGG